jgi:transposase
MGDLSDFERQQIVGARLVEASVTQSATLLGVSRATVSEVMSAYTDHGKTKSGKRNSGRNSTLTERDRRTLRRIYFEKSQTYCSTGDSITEYSS